MEGRKVIGIDPGGTTGLVIHQVGVGNPFEQSELGPDAHHRELWSFLNKHQPAVICLEEFVYQIRKRAGGAMPGIQLISKEYIGVVKLWVQIQNAHRAPCELVLRKAADVMSFWSDSKLKALGVYNAPQGREHMNDATRHLLQWLVFDLKMKDYLNPTRDRP